MCGRDWTHLSGGWGTVVETRGEERFFAFQPTDETRDQADAAWLRRSGARATASDVVPAVHAEKDAGTSGAAALPAATAAAGLHGAERAVDRPLRPSNVSRLVHVLHLRLLVRPPKGPRSFSLSFSSTKV